MQHINSEQLYSDSQYRFDYVAKFMDFGKFFFFFFFFFFFLIMGVAMVN
jgi:hypothetical protein